MTLRKDKARTSVVVVGVGGQGSVFVTRVLGEAALRSDLGVVSSELHGMAQRGGVVESTVIMGRAHGPIIPPGEADLLIALEPLEGLRAISHVRKGGAAVVGMTPIVPYTVSLGAPPYPSMAEITTKLKAWLERLALIQLQKIAENAGERRAIGAAALGAVAGLNVLPITKEVLATTTLDLAPPKKRRENELAFEQAFEVASRG